MGALLVLEYNHKIREVWGVFEEDSTRRLKRNCCRSTLKHATQCELEVIWKYTNSVTKQYRKGCHMLYVVHLFSPASLFCAG